MSIFDRYPIIVRPLFGLLAAVLTAGALITFVNYAGSPTDENLFADLPRGMNLCVVKTIPSLGSDSLRPGDFIDKINGTAVRDSSAFASLLLSAHRDSVLDFTVYRPSTLSASMTAPPIAS